MGELHKLNAGRKPVTANTLKGKEIMRQIDPLAVSVIKDRLDDGNLDAAKFVYEHNHGKAKQQVDQTTTINITVTSGEILKQIRQVEQDSNAILEQREPVLMAEYSVVEEDSE